MKIPANTTFLFGSMAPFAGRSQSKPGFLDSRRLHRYNVLSIFNAANNFTDGPNKSLNRSGVSGLCIRKTRMLMQLTAARLTLPLDGIAVNWKCLHSKIQSKRIMLA